MEKPKGKVDANALAVKERRVAALLVEAKRGLLPKVDERFEDAVAHAELAVTKVAKAAADGGPTLAAIRHNRSHEAARKRLLEIADMVADGVAVARRAIFAESARLWRDVLDPALLRDKPLVAGMVSAAAAELVDGRKVADDCKIQAARAADDLERTLVLVSSRATSPSDGTDLLKAWSERWGRAVRRHAEGLLEDAAYRCDYLAGRAVCRPSLLVPDPSIPWE